MTCGQAQAGNRASKTRPYLQWWVNSSEQDAATSALQNLHHYTRIILLYWVRLAADGGRPPPPLEYSQLKKFNADRFLKRGPRREPGMKGTGDAVTTGTPEIMPAHGVPVKQRNALTVLFCWGFRLLSASAPG